MSALCCPFSAVNTAFDTTVRVNAARFASAVGVSVMLPILLLLVFHFTLRSEQTLPVFVSRWCRRYTADFSAVGAAFCPTARVNATRFSAVGVGVVLPILSLLVPPFTLRLG